MLLDVNGDAIIVLEAVPEGARVVRARPAKAEVGEEHL